MDSSTLPDSPGDYRAPYEPVTAISWLELFPGEVGLLFGSVGLFGGLTILIRDGAVVFDVFGRAATLDSVGGYIALVAAVGITLLLHEGVHVVAARRFGCTAQIKRQGLGLRVRLRGGFSRGEQTP